MSDPTSRYDHLPTALHVAADGQAVVYRGRRFLPPVRAGAADRGVAERGVVVQAGERLDLVAARTLGDPLQFWRIADANAAMNPLTLAIPGHVLRIPAVGGSGS